MKRRPHRKPRENDLTARYESGELEETGLDAQQRFGSRSKDAEIGKILRTTLQRAEEQTGEDVETLPIGEVIQVFSLFSEVESGGTMYLCVVRKTLTRVSDSAILVGDRVRFRALGLIDEQGRPQAVIEQILPRTTILTRTDSFKGVEQHPIVANAERMLIVASLRDPQVRWGLIDRMLIAAQSGKLEPLVCLNKMDLAHPEEDPLLAEANEALVHYERLGIATLKTSVELTLGLDRLIEFLRQHTTVLAGHSGVGKSSLINAVEPGLNLRTAQISGYTGKGRHTTTSARRYPLTGGGALIDTPGVKLFGLWGVTRENLPQFFPDVEAGTAPAWRKESFERIEQSLPEE